MPKLLRVLLVSTVLVSPALGAAQQQRPVLEYAMIDGYASTGTGLEITGLREGAGQATTVLLNVNSTVLGSCENMLELMMERPGRYKFSAQQSTSGSVVRCAIVRER
jgi:hypothetical protein